jgi:hypothetical protein
LKNSFKYFNLPVLIWISISTIISLFVAFNDNIYKAIKFFSVFLLATGVIYILPLLIIYVNHRKYNNNSKLVVSGSESGVNLFEYKSPTEEINFTENEVIKCEANLSPSLYNKRTSLLFSDEYFFYKIYLQNRTLHISCLICNDLEKYIPKCKMKKIKNYFPLI